MDLKHFEKICNILLLFLQYGREIPVEEEQF